MTNWNHFNELFDIILSILYTIDTFILWFLECLAKIIYFQKFNPQNEESL